MSLVVDLSFVVRGMLDGRERIEIRRLEPLIDPTDPADETHPYAVTVYRSGIPVEQARIKHRYGDGARVLAKKALEALIECKGCAWRRNNPNFPHIGDDSHTCVEESRA